MRRAPAWRFVALLSLAVSASIAQQGDAGFAKRADGIGVYQFAVDEDALGGPPDLSALNRRLDKTSRIFVRDGHFYRVGPDGQPGTKDDVRTRLVGINLTFGSNFPSGEEAPQLARRLRKLGFNAVRLHHLDSFPVNAQDPPTSILTREPFPTFHTEAVARLKNFISVLATEGIYVNLNLHVGYRFRSAVDAIPDRGTSEGSAPIGTPLHVFNRRMIELQEKYAAGLIRTLGLQGNPALAMVEINNESSLLAAWHWQWWDSVTVGAYGAQLQSLWQAWVIKKHGSLVKACASWDGCADSASATLPQPGDFVRKGPSARQQDFLQFLAETDKAYFDRLRAVVHEQTDPLVPVTGTQMLYGGALNFDSHAAMDYVDEHIYVDHPDSGSPNNVRDWRIRDVGPSGGEQFDRLLALSFRRQVGKPFVVSEFGQPYPNTRRTELFPLMATIASLQDWDGLFYFDYTFRAQGMPAPSEFSLSGDWGTYASAAPSAQLFREGWISPLVEQKVVALPLQERLAIATAPGLGAWERVIADRLGVRAKDALAYRIAVDPKATDVSRTLKTLPAPSPASSSTSLSFDAAAHRFRLQGARIWGVMGDAGGSTAVGPSFNATFTGREGSHVTALLTSLDGKNLQQSDRLLLTLATATAASQPGSNPARPKELVRYKGKSDWVTLETDPQGADEPSGSLQQTVGPSWLRVSPMRLHWNAGSARMEVFPLDGKGKRMAALPSEQVKRNEDGVTVSFQATVQQASPWYEIVVHRTAEPEKKK